MILPATRPRRVILVDDDQSLRRALARTIRLAGFEVESYETAEAMLAHGTPSGDVCLVLDIHLPGLGGFALKHALELSHCEPRAVFITALQPAEIHDALARFAPSATVLHKPFSNEALIEAINRAS